MTSLNRSIRFVLLGSVAMLTEVLGAGNVSAQTEKLNEAWKKPRALKPGDTIVFVAPAGPIELAPLQEYAKRLEKAGYKVVIPKGIDRKTGYLAGSDEDRAAELNHAIRDPKVRAIFPCRGGYGLTRILDKIDYAALRKDPKIITGFSDLTALHLAIAARAKVITFHSPMSMRDLGQEKKELTFSAASFKRAIFADEYKNNSIGYSIDLPVRQPLPLKLVGGKARGRLIGGNLTLICSTLGTPYAIQPKGAILFIEDINEAPYRVDRSLSQLRLAGVLDSVAGIVVGNFSDKETKDAEDFTRVLRDYFAALKVPVVMNFPVGHIPNNATLPHGALVELDGDAASVRLLENPVLVD